jgi:hypothetical protein
MSIAVQAVAHSAIAAQPTLEAAAITKTPPRRRTVARADPTIVPEAR